jgi:hypothetical protein
VIRRNGRTLIAGAGFLAVAVCLGIWAAGDAAPALHDQPRIFMPPHLALPNSADLAAYASTVSRPLFSPDRRPSPVAPAAGDQAAQGRSENPLPVSRLVAVAIGPDRSAAIVQLTAGGSQVLMQGEHIEDWVLAQIAPDHVVLRRGTRQAAISLPAHLPGQK